MKFKNSLACRIFKQGQVSPRCFEFTGTIFIHIPKNAGQSISNTLYGQTIHHKKAVFFKKFNYKFYKNAFVFACVRDPVDRFKSAYSYLQAGGQLKQEKKMTKTLSNRSLDSFIDYLSSVEVDKIPDLSHFHTQTSYVAEENAPRSLIVDRIYKMNELETLVRDFKILSKVQPLHDVLPKINTSNSHRITLTSQQEEKIQRIYRIDYVNFFNF